MYPFDNLDMQNRMYMHAKLDKIKEIYFLKTVNMNSVARKYSPLDMLSSDIHVQCHTSVICYI